MTQQSKMATGDLACTAGIPIRGEQKDAVGEGEGLKSGGCSFLLASNGNTCNAGYRRPPSAHLFIWIPSAKCLDNKLKELQFLPHSSLLTPPLPRDCTFQHYIPFLQLGQLRDFLDLDFNVQQSQTKNLNYFLLQWEYLNKDH